MSDIETYPYKVGRMVYETLEEAMRKARSASKSHPTHFIGVIDRRTNKVLATYHEGNEQ